MLSQAQQQPMMMRTPLPMNNMNMTMPPPPPPQQQQQQPQQPQTSYSSTPSNHPINGAAIFQSYSAANKTMPSPFQPPSYSNNNSNINSSYNNGNSNRSFTSTTPLPPNRGDRDYSFFNTSYDSQLNESEQVSIITMMLIIVIEYMLMLLIGYFPSDRRVVRLVG